MPEPLSREMRQVLLELEMLSHGTTQGWNKSSPPAERDPRPAAGELFPSHEELRIDWEIADSDDARAAVLKRAREALVAWKFGSASAKPAKLRTQLDIDNEMRGYAGWLPRDIARRTGNTVTEGAVMQWRRARGLDPSTGYEQRTEDPTMQAQRLKDQGLGVREIARYQQVQPSTVARRLKKAA
jgi:hypothetical protein